MRISVRAGIVLDVENASDNLGTYGGKAYIAFGLAESSIYFTF